MEVALEAADGVCRGPFDWYKHTGCGVALIGLAGGRGLQEVNCPGGQQTRPIRGYLGNPTLLIENARSFRYLFLRSYLCT